MTDKYEIYEYEDGFKRVLKNGKAINEFGLLKDVQKLQAENAELTKREQKYKAGLKAMRDVYPTPAILNYVDNLLKGDSDE